MIFNIFAVTELKKKISELFSVEVHFHDACGGQYFTVDELTDEMKAFLIEYFSERKLKVHFSESGDSFTVEEIS